jgi:hypothetical protein
MVFKLFSLGRDQAASTALPSDEKASRLRPTTSQATFDGAFASFEEQEDEEQRQRDCIWEQVAQTLSTTTTTTTPSFKPSSVPLGRLVPGFLYGKEENDNAGHTYIHTGQRLNQCILTYTFISYQ